jgi:hypothetical protein
MGVVAMRESYTARSFHVTLDRRSPHFEMELAISVDHFKIRSIGRNQAGAVGAGGEGDEDVEVKIAQLGGCKTAIGANAGQDLTRFEPIVFRWSEDRMTSRQNSEKFPI